MNWQPIETAPRDRPVLVNDTNEGMPVAAFALYSVGEEWSGWVYEDEVMLDCNPLGPAPTHWFDLPAPPEQQTRDAQKDDTCQ